MAHRNRAATRCCAVAIAFAALLSLVGGEAAQARSACGTEQAKSSGQIFGVVAGGVSCATARSVAGRWFELTSRGRSGAAVSDERRRRWHCRVTQKATGTDPGFIPFTSVRCTHNSAVARFRQRS